MSESSGTKSKRRRAGAGAEPPPKKPAQPARDPIYLRVSRSGEWMDAAELRACAMTHASGDRASDRASDLAAESAPHLVLDLKGLDHLDARALQVVLAIRAGERGRGRELALEHVSGSLSRWFAWAGAEDLIPDAQTAQKPAEEPRACAEF